MIKSKILVEKNNPELVELKQNEFLETIDKEDLIEIKLRTHMDSNDDIWSIIVIYYEV